VGKDVPTLSTTVFDASTNTAVAGPVPEGATVYDTTKLTSTSGLTPTGTVTYTFYRGGTCTTGTMVGTETLDVTGGLVPNSGNQGPLTAASGPYAFEAQYSGDASFVAGSSDCEPFGVAPGSADLSTTVFDASTNAAVISPVALGSTVYDVSRLISQSPGVAPTGTVTYTFYSSGDCTTGTVVGTKIVNVAAGLVPNSGNQGPLTAASGPYAFQATYSGDANFVSGSSDCEPFGVASGAANPSTAVFDASTDTPIASPVPLGASVYDTSELISEAPGVTPTGTETYTFYSGGDCTTGAAVSSRTVTVGVGGVVPNSPNQGPLGPGMYAFQAQYSGDSNFVGSATTCEPFTVARGATDPSTTVFDVSSNARIASPVPLGATVYDTAALAATSGVTPTGTVTYTFYRGGDCTSGTVVGTDTVTIAGGVVPHSVNEGPLGAAGGPYAFQAMYSGDANFDSGSSECEPFSVAQGSADLSTTVFDASTGVAIASPVPLGTTVYDIAKLASETPGLAPTGTVTYTFYEGGECTTGTVLGTQTVTIGIGGAVPHSASRGPLSAAGGPYAYTAGYSGDANFVKESGDCEPFGVGQAAADPSTTVVDASTGAAAVHLLPLGSTVYDTLNLTSIGGFTVAGTGTYTFFSSGGCVAGTAIGADTVTIGSDGSVPRSGSRGPLGNGHYAFEGHYAGDANYLAGTSQCEPLSVDKAAVALSTTAFDVSTGRPVSGTLPAGSTVFDTATLTTTSGITPTGTVTYTFYAGGDCTTGTMVATDTVTIAAAGSAPASHAQGPLTTGGPYSFQAEYSSDPNFLGGGSGCEPFTVASASSTGGSSTPLAMTGLAVTLYAAVAAALLGVGVALERLSRRKRANRHAEHRT
jgi:hypothetical protein